ncbi:MAG TPA: alpha/beta hydrolase-fold protein [Bacteroidota bacterium]|nr:alpha/beta hydrolase-fold protein [Bacteroidota bacterium]
MKTSCVNISAILLFAVFSAASLKGASFDSSSTAPAVEIAGTQSLHITSMIVNQEFNLYVNLPRDYQDSARTFPVIYLLDGQWDFPLVQAIFGQQYYDGFVPSAIVVAVAWGGNNPNYDMLRVRDLTPTAPKELPQSGNAPNFLKFIKTELIPFIDARYRTKKDDRTLMGSSLGGLFTLYALFQETSTFQRYVLTSPAIGWDNNAIAGFEKNYTPAKTLHPVKLFMAVGGLEGNESSFEKFAADLKAKKLEGLEIETRVLEGTGHSGGKAEGYTRGLQFVFAKPSIEVSTAVLDEYVGAYRINPQVSINISREEQHLMVAGPDGVKMALWAETEQDFYRKGVFLFVHFKRDNKGKVIGMTVDQYGGSQFIEKAE